MKSETLQAYNTIVNPNGVIIEDNGDDVTMHVAGLVTLSDSSITGYVITIIYTQSSPVSIVLCWDITCQFGS